MLGYAVSVKRESLFRRHLSVARVKQARCLRFQGAPRLLRALRVAVAHHWAEALLILRRSNE